jgi:hypothetical protein
MIYRVLAILQSKKVEGMDPLSRLLKVIMYHLKFNIRYRSRYRSGL